MKTERFDHLKQDFYDAELVERVTISCDDKNYKVSLLSEPKQLYCWKV